MTCTLHVTWDDRLAGYDFGPAHPMAPVRLKLTIELARAFGLFHLDGVSVEVPAAATRAELELYHAPGYVDVVRLAGSGRLLGPGRPDMTERVLLMHGLGTDDDPVFPGMHEAAAMVTGATLAAARAGARQPWSSGGTMRTGQCACWATWLDTEPIISRVNPPAPREPRTIMSASLPASMISSTG